MHILNNDGVCNINAARFSALRKKVLGVTKQRFQTWANGVWEVWLKQKLKAIKRRQLRRRARTATNAQLQTNPTASGPSSSSSSTPALRGETGMVSSDMAEQNSHDADLLQSGNDMQGVAVSSAVDHNANHFDSPVNTTNALAQFTPSTLRRYFLPRLLLIHLLHYIIVLHSILVSCHIRLEVLIPVSRRPSRRRVNSVLLHPFRPAEHVLRSTTPHYPHQNGNRRKGSFLTLSNNG
jgi:hypothetical protein